MLDFTQPVDQILDNQVKIFILIWFWPYLIMGISSDYPNILSPLAANQLCGK